MHKSVHLLESAVLVLGATALVLSAAENKAEPDRTGSVRSDVSASFSYTLPSKVSYNGTTFGDLDTIHYRLGYLAGLRLSQDWEFRTGLEYQQYAFGVPEGAPLPNSLYSVAVPLGVNWRLNEAWSLRFQVSPGLYSDFKDISGDDLYVPVMAGAGYTVNSNLHVLFGLAAERRRDIPVLPFAGVRWHFAEPWTLSLLFPRPGLEYAATKQLSFFAGGDLKGGAFQVNEHFGDRVGQPQLNNESLTYWEVRVGAGARYRLARGLSAELDGGWAVLRRFVFREHDETVKGHGAPYVQTSLIFSF